MLPGQIQAIWIPANGAFIFQPEFRRVGPSQVFNPKVAFQVGQATVSQGQAAAVKR